MTKELRLAALGLIGVVVLVGATVCAIAYRSGAFHGEPELTLVVPASAGPLRAQSQVQYRGVIVGTVADVEPGKDSSTVTLDVPSPQMLPAAAKARILPRTLFGDQYVDIVADDPTPGLRAGTTIPHDESAPTAQLYAAVTKLYDLLGSLHPAELSAALGAVADAFRGKGAELGALIDRAHQVVTGAGPLAEAVLGDLSTVSTLSDELARSAPDLFRTLDNAVSLSDTLVAKKDDLHRLLLAGTEASDVVGSTLVDNADRVITLVHDAGSVMDTVSAHPGVLPATVRDLGDLLAAVTRAFSHGPWVAIKAPLTLDDPYPYTAKDCPRYGDLAGPNCGGTPPGGTVGSVGSPGEKQRIEQLTGPQPDVLDVLLAPLLRGTTVVTGK
ncbi:MCE family protein [Amycolatopsis sp. K13G38]|uniref:MCE family protein n=1 Tax=Amycolatopsis acididurans TaxID=2724524 RepID=A0ABX1IYY2_9PSEU|nr:MCE family protein [Amycolatopsis acididurans]NKQ52716.1 MCE family protein [Amycolatopsis acididurans]